MRKEENARKLLRAMTDVQDDIVQDAMDMARIPADGESGKAAESLVGAENMDSQDTTGSAADGGAVQTTGDGKAYAANRALDETKGKKGHKHGGRLLRFRQTLVTVAVAAVCLIVGMVTGSLTGWLPVGRMGASSSSSEVGTYAVDSSYGEDEAYDNSTYEGNDSVASSYSNDSYGTDSYLGSSDNISDTASADTAASENAAADESAEDNTTEDSAYSTEETADSVASRSAQLQKKIVYTGNVSLETKDYDTARNQLSDQISRYSGFVESSSEWDNGTDTTSQRTYDVTVRIPAENFDAFMNGFGSITGKVISKNISSEDMTRTYSDNADRIEALEAEQKSLIRMLERADSVDAMIAIQKELADVRAELAQLHHENSGIEYDASYSTVTITLDEVVTYAPQRTSFGERIYNALQGSGRTFVSFLQGLAVVIIYLLPYIAIAAAVILVIALIRKRHREGKQ